MSGHRYFKHWNPKGVKLKVGGTYKVSWIGNEFIDEYKFVKSTMKGYNFKNLRTGEYFHKKHIYRNKYQNGLFMISNSLKVQYIKTEVEIFKIL